MKSPLDGLRIRRLLAKVPEDVEYVCPISLFFDEFTEVDKFSLCCNPLHFVRLIKVNPVGVFANSNKMAIFEYRFINENSDMNPFCFFLAAGMSVDLKPKCKTECNCIIFDNVYVIIKFRFEQSCFPNSQRNRSSNCFDNCEWQNGEDSSGSYSCMC